jgi:SAM-dependent methyltransferase
VGTSQPADGWAGEQKAGMVSWDYGTLASEIYELDKPIGHSFGDTEYYTRLLGAVRGKILEPAAGTGRILIPLLEAGLDVEGLDTSPEMPGPGNDHWTFHASRS